MYSGSAQGVVERVINVRYFIIIINVPNTFQMTLVITTFDQSTVAQRAETTVTECSLMNCV